MAMPERITNIIIPFDSGVTIDVVNTGAKTVGYVWSISDQNPEFCDIDTAIILGFPEIYVLWMNNLRQLGKLSTKYEDWRPSL